MRVERHASVGSTNSLAFDRARSGDPGHLWIIAGEQTAGRGRRGREWASPTGNLFASYLMVSPEPRERMGELPLVTAVALAEAIDNCAGTYHMSKLKWPNDLLVDGAKLSGILLEAETMANGRTALVLGVGVNCVTHPEQSLYPCTDLASLGYRVSAQQLFDVFARGLHSWIETWRRTTGFEGVRKAWLSRAAHLGQTITVRNGSKDLTGVFDDLDSRGHLVLSLENGHRETIFAGDVFLQGSQPDGSP
ncbi:biotin--[acetyl-CoA-carboxylase] ligase [Roseibium sp.]|uniref:biotin--[acetyl-CoA-carboxylase] ligase n=1 Tax=Roseibium sp. TaxID=1936156 RepID=UPI003A97BCFC